MKQSIRHGMRILLLALTSLTAPMFAQSSKTPVKITAFPSGISRYEPGEWASIGVQASNSTDAEANPLLVVYFGQSEQIQFARQMWLPPKSLRKTWMPVRVPKGYDPTKSSISMTLMPLGDSAQGEIIKKRASGEMVDTLYVTIDRDLIKSAGIYRKGLPNAVGMIEDLDSDAYDFYVHAKQFAESSRVVMEFSDDFIPPHGAMWDSLDQLVICSDRIVDDSAGLATMRDWLQRGGRAWVFLDRVQPSTVAALLGHSHCFQVVDRVELDDFSIDSFTTVMGADGHDLRRFERPVEIVRVVTDAEVVCRVNQWPAAFVQRVGAGEIMLVALSPRGWLPAPIRPGDEQLPENTSPEYRSTGAIASMSKRFFDLPPNKSPAQPVVEPILQEQIGYQIPRRGLAAALLGLNCFGLIAVGGWLATRHRLDHLAWLVPTLAIITTAIFIVIGRQNSRSVPPSVAFTQLIRVFPDNEEATVTGIAGLYHQNATPLKMSGGRSGLVEPMAPPTAGSIRRLLWTDEDSGHWQNVVFPGGSVQFVDFRRPTKLPAPIKASVRFGQQGLEGRLDAGQLGKLQDTVITNIPAPSLLVHMDADGKFAAGADDVLAQGQFTSDRVLSDEARRRQAIYRQVVAAQDDQRLGSGANLLGWTGAVECGLDWPKDLQQTGAALVALPLRIERTPSGQAFSVPSTFLQPKASSNEMGQSMAYNDRTGVWLSGLTRTSRSALRFPVPAEVLPCQVNQARLTIKLNAPSRKLRVFSVLNKQEHLIQEIANPNGVITINVNQPELLPPVVEDSLYFTLEITESAAERQAREEIRDRSKPSPLNMRDAERKAQLATSFTTWQIDYVRLDVSGVVK
jgi:hypothetical protein